MPKIERTTVVYRSEGAYLTKALVAKTSATIAAWKILLNDLGGIGKPVEMIESSSAQRQSNHEF